MVKQQKIQNSQNATKVKANTPIIKEMEAYYLKAISSIKKANNNDTFCEKFLKTKKQKETKNLIFKIKSDKIETAIASLSTYLN